MTTKVYLVNGWYNYYPYDDNTIAVFLKKEDAENFLEDHLKTIEYRLDRYKIFEKELLNDD